MIGRAALVLLAVLAAGAVGAAVWWWRYRAAERACLQVVDDASALFDGGQPLAALERIDAVDARCRCSRFTSGDEPPEYSLARACLKRLREQGQGADADRALAAARGPILRELRGR
jgi:hypothetical protein